jgi:hypothetical protein
MCFSATASFTAGAILTVTGIASIKKTTKKAQIPFAAIPFIFGIQQLAEGFLWLSLSDKISVNASLPMAYVFLFFAQILWPFWVPYSMLRADRQKESKILLGIGLIVSLYLAFCLMSFPVIPKVEGHHIVYYQFYPPKLRVFGWILYLIATVIPPLLSKIKGMKYFGAMILFSCIIAIVFYEEYFISVWCYFAAVLSFTVYLIIHFMNKKSI